MGLRTVGSRTQRPIGPPAPPTAEERAWLMSLSKRRTRVPKGVFRYRSQAEANEEWGRWNAELVAQTVAAKRA